MNTAIVSPTGGSVGIGFAIPSEIAQQVVDELRDKGAWTAAGWVSEPDTGGAQAPGVRIAAVDRGGPAARAGLRPGDLVTAINGDRVESTRELIRACPRSTRAAIGHVAASVAAAQRLE